MLYRLFNYVKSALSNPEGSRYRSFKSGVQEQMSLHDIKQARMVGGLFEVDEHFLSSLKRLGIKNFEQPYDFNFAAVFVADTADNRQSPQDKRDVRQSKAIPFLATEDAEGNFRLIGLHNLARSYELGQVSGYDARKIVHKMRTQLLNSCKLVAEEDHRYYTQSDTTQHHHKQSLEL